MATRIDVSPDLFIEYSEVGYVDIVNATSGRNAMVDAAELPALLARLTQAAEAMGVETATNNALVVAQTRTTWMESVIRMAHTQLESGNPTYALDTLGQAVQALAKAEAK